MTPVIYWLSSLKNIVFWYIQNDEPTLKGLLNIYQVGLPLKSFMPYAKNYSNRYERDILKEDIYRIDNRYNEIKKTAHKTRNSFL